jgi:hypothetical protein
MGTGVFRAGGENSWAESKQPKCKKIIQWSKSATSNFLRVGG